MRAMCQSRNTRRNLPAPLSSFCAANQPNIDASEALPPTSNRFSQIASGPRRIVDANATYRALGIIIKENISNFCCDLRVILSSWTIFLRARESWRSDLRPRCAKLRCLESRG